jgi:hypothetical protein
MGVIIIGSTRTGPARGTLAGVDEDTNFEVTCPYCGEHGEIYIEPDVIGTLVQDCEVCCRPWQVHVSRDSDYRYVDIMRGDGSE